MIVAISDTRYSKYLTWKPSGACLFLGDCIACPFFKKLQDSYDCVTYRDLLISLTNQDKLPYTFDTDDYPEAFI